VRIGNVSRTGLALVVDRAWGVGTVLVLELPGEERPTRAQARVIHMTPQIVAGTFLIGCTLEVSLTDAQLQALTS
jgi:hypothetical protein